MTDRKRRDGWPAFLEWALALGLLALTIIGAASIGLFVAPFAVAALVLAARRNRSWPEAVLGGFAGVGVLCLFVAYRSPDYPPCPPPGTRITLARGEHLACDSFDAAPWLAVGLALVGIALAGHLAYRHTHERSTTDTL